jgi:signal transduction histidine kinase
MGHLELVRASADLPRAIRRDLAVAWRDAVRASRIVRNLLVFAGSGRLNMRLVNLNAVVTRVFRLRARSLKATGVEVVRQLDADLPLVRADGLLLQQAILNVVINAEQAMAGAGRITIRSLVASGAGSVRLEVEDSGPGVPADVRGRLFEPFFTTKEVGKGTGLGLAIAFGIVQAHRGTLVVDNHAGGGARFALSLPIATDRARAAAL